MGEESNNLFSRLNGRLSKVMNRNQETQSDFHSLVSATTSHCYPTPHPAALGLRHPSHTATTSHNLPLLCLCALLLLRYQTNSPI